MERKGHEWGFAPFDTPCGVRALLIGGAAMERVENREQPLPLPLVPGAGEQPATGSSWGIYKSCQWHVF